MRNSLQLLLGLAVVALASPVSANDRDFFENRIRPVLAESCYECHSAETEKHKGNLQLDHIEHLLTGGDTGPSITPGRPGDSLLLEAISYSNPDLEMPPKKRLPPEVVADFRTWIEKGAYWPDEPVPDISAGEDDFDLAQRHAEHWSWRVVAAPETLPGDPALSPVDRLIRSRLTENGLRPAHPADPRSWLRRVTFDLTGLPPTREEIASFLADSSAAGRRAVVDRLLASPRFGETWARHWMDLVRYAETYGHEFDYPIDYAHEYRDYLIRALNLDLPYDQFITEHVAGDLLSTPRRHPDQRFNESVIGTGFWWFHEATHAPTDVLADEADRMSNQIDVFGKAFLGLTISCARCHDHKFDAISTADYYALTAYLQGSARTERSLDPGGHRQAAAGESRRLLAIADPHLPSGLGKRASPYFRAATQLIRAALSDEQTSGDPWSGVVFEDFEGGFDNWRASGDAFGPEPLDGPRGAQKTITGFRGNRFANSYAHGSDRNSGELRSAPFRIAHPYINFLVGGGAHETTAIELWVDGKQVRRTSGENVDRFRAESWAVSAYHDEMAEIRIVDRHRGGWGHVIIDHIVFSDTPAASPASLPLPSREAIARAAADASLDRATLERWCRTIASAPDTDGDPATFLANWIRNPAHDPSLPTRIARARSLEQTLRSNSVPFARFASGTLPDGWRVEGQAFTSTGDRSGLTLAETHRLTPREVISSIRLGENHNGVLRSPSFEIESDYIHVKLRARGASARVVPDGYHMAKFNQLLFRGTLHPDIHTAGAFRWISFGRDLTKYRGHRAYLEFVDKGKGYIEIDDILFSDEPTPPDELHPVIAHLASGGIPQDLAEMTRRWHSATADPGIADWLLANSLLPPNAIPDPARAALTKGRALAADLPPDRFAVTIASTTEESARVYVRGSHRSLGEVVPPRFLEALGGAEGDRLTLARAVADPANPLTSRVLVNRVWHQLFGRGLVSSVDDFGPMGEEPTHPELLDWLAHDFVSHGWSLKHLLRELVLTETYGQATVAHPDVDPASLASADPQNLLLHRMPVKRLRAEAIRDGILSVSGTLDTTMFGRSIPTHRTPFMSGRGARASGPLDGEGRRTIYGAVYRNFLSPFLLTFDMPAPFGPKGRRDTSNVPAQALALMNDPFIVQEAERWATRLLEDEGTDAERIELMFETVTGKTPEPGERQHLISFLETQRQAHAENGPPTESDRRAWADLAHALFNTKRFLYLN